MNLEEAHAALVALARRVEPVGGRIEVEGDTLWLDHPAARGALSVEMMVQLAAAVPTLRDRGLVFVRSRGEGTFCSGGHLGQVRASLADPASGRAMADAMAAVLDGLANLPAVVVAWVDGPALGGGAELLTACDLVVAGPRARIGFIQSRWGVSTGWGGGRRLIARVGRSRALRLLALHEVLDPEQAQALGLVDRVDTTPTATLQRLRRSGEPVLRELKRMVRYPDDEADVFEALWGGPEHLRRLAAAQERQDQG